MNRLFSAVALTLGLFAEALHGQSFDLHSEIEKADKQTLAAAAKSIEENTEVKVALTVDAASFGSDPQAWSNLRIIANRIVGALGEVGRDQVGKDAIDRDVKKIVIVKIAANAEDALELKNQTVYVRTSASDKAMTVLQNVIVNALEKALNTGHPPKE
jgi:hypothetical protein